MSYKICNVSYEGKYIPLYDYPHERTNENVFTVLIGKNGSGKSRVLSAIANTLCSVFVGNKLLKRDIGAGSKYKQEDHYFSIKVISGNDIHEIEINGRSISNSFRSQYDKNKFCPNKIIAVSTSPFDKFPEERVYFSSKINDDDDSFYNYYGLNESAKNKAVLSLIEKLFFSAAKGSLNKDQYTIPKVLSFLGFESKFELHFRLKHGINRFMENLYEMKIGQFMTYVASAAQRELNFLKNKYDITYSKLCNAFVSLYEYCNKTDSSRVIIFEIDYSKNQVDDYFKKFLSDIKILSDIGILSVYDVIVRSSENNDEEKDIEDFFYEEENREFSINDASSGQQCILLNVFGIAASIEDDSLILIDEPEISLHPEWQETYIHLLMEVFTHIKGCHFIIATHSPQIISNLSGENCFVTLIENGDIIPAKNYVNKSADFQLATLFEAPGVENEYLKRIAVNILTDLSNGTYDKNNNSSDLELLIKNRNKIDENDSVRKLIDLAVEIERKLQK